ncbi:MAG: cobalamin-dependent protein [Spirochaetes bacterium]|nr:cobalamin-dependent protein [Spirochaetota bacterium]
MSDSLEAVRDAVVEMRDEEISSLVLACLDEGYSPVEVIEKAVAPGLEIVGHKFENGDFFLADLILAGEVVTQATGMLKERMSPGEGAEKGKVILATVRGDVHDIGKRVVGMLLAASGYEVIDLGIDVPAEKIVETARTTGAAMIGLSALLTTMVGSIREVVERMTEAGLRERVKIAIGGACCSQSLADEMGVDAYGESAVAAVRIFDGFTGVVNTD